MSETGHDESGDRDAHGANDGGSGGGGFDDGGFDDGVIADEAIEDDEPRTHDGIPITGYYRGEPIPDLNALAQDRWLEVLRPLSHWPRAHAIARVRTAEQARVALAIKGQLWLEDGPPPSLADDAVPPMPAGAPPARGASRQINFRLGPDEHASLVEAARLFAMRPTTLARVLTVRGVSRALYEERRHR
jgi:hypothetical protein